jgi:uncharacterized membrane protein YdjX (TVP38/TMEM64 family)
MPPRLRLALAVVAALVLLAAALALQYEAPPRLAMAWVVARRAEALAHPALSAAAYFVFYVAFAALSMPGASVVSVAAGALFGPWLGIPLASLSSAAGATAAMLVARYLAREAAAARFPHFAAQVDKGVARDGARWLFAARLTPVIPFFAVNLAAGLTKLPALTFALVSLVGALPLATLYVMAGARLADVARPGDVVSAPILAALLALAAAPFAAKALARRSA